PAKALQDLPEIDRQPGDDARLRTVTATFGFVSGKLEQADQDAGPTRKAAVPRPAATTDEKSTEDEGFTWPANLTRFLRRRYATPVLLLVAALFGAFPALTPGHGKTMVAAYLVGERGTVWHAVLLGLVTTLTHTGAVLLVAVALNLFFPQGRISPQEQ